MVFTDGQDTKDSYRLDGGTAYTNQNDLRLYTVDLNQGVDLEIGGELACATDGTCLWATEAPRLVAAFGYAGCSLKQ